MRITFLKSASLTSTALPRCFLRFLDLEVRMWRRFALCRLIFPVPVFLKRLAAPLCVFSLGINSSQLSVVSSQLHRQQRNIHLLLTQRSHHEILLMAES